MTQRTTKLRSIVVYLQPNERQAVVELAAEARLSVSNYIRGMLGLPELARGARGVAAAKLPRYDEAHPAGASPAPADGVPPASAGMPAPRCICFDGGNVDSAFGRCPEHGAANPPKFHCSCHIGQSDCAVHSQSEPPASIRRLEGFPTLRKPAKPVITDDEIDDLLQEIEEEP